ncbi:MAG TPA: response regulator [Xanthomonadaceae bacterium]|nr:response regulator [Xanthomonadaceae bacterium]
MQPKILLVEDDPVSRAFLAAAVAALPATVDAVTDCAAAERHAVDGGHDLWLIDAHLPDGDGDALLARLRRGAATPALGHTASHDRHELDRLLAAGFLEVLVKPVAPGALRAAIRRALGKPGAIDADTPRQGATPPVWDDEGAIATLKGERAHVEALRRLFLDELPGQRLAVDAALAAGDGDGAAHVLHRLRASCGFVGAAGLAQAVHALEADMHAPAALRRFDEAVDELLGADPTPAG